MAAPDTITGAFAVTEASVGNGSILVGDTGSETWSVYGVPHAASGCVLHEMPTSRIVSGGSSFCE
jgi:hypothetical protein